MRSLSHETCDLATMTRMTSINSTQILSLLNVFSIRYRVSCHCRSKGYSYQILDFHHLLNFDCLSGSTRWALQIWFPGFSFRVGPLIKIEQVKVPNQTTAGSNNPVWCVVIDCDVFYKLCHMWNMRLHDGYFRCKITNILTFKNTSIRVFTVHICLHVYCMFCITAPGCSDANAH